VPFQAKSSWFDNCPGTDAAGADPHADSASAAADCPDILKIGQPAAAAFIMSMADNIARHRAFSTNFTFIRHDIFSLKEFCSYRSDYSYLPAGKNASPFPFSAAEQSFFLLPDAIPA
jgi:hypothetical protein